ncbi:MAG: energy-coupling factor ABC transporter ATP-binding protein [Oscillospiraceae bacterium]|nr:energy-coupling factor ABC transporter ATP-binding protein [Oscillospiraceae bacterium]
MIVVEGLEYTYSPKTPNTLKGINFTINQGEMVAVIGQNGAGKSTLLRQLNGLAKPTKGKVTVAGIDTKNTPVSVLAKHIGYLFQNPDHQIFCQTVGKEIEFGMRNIGMPEDEIKLRSEKTAALLSLSGKMEDHPFNLSRGERQRAALAGVLAVAPEVLVLDEPTTGQDYRECIEIMDIVTAANKKGTTVLMVSHDMEIVLDYAQRTIMMCDGRIVEDGRTTEVLRKAEKLAGTGLKPPQIIELALSLGGYDDAYDVDTMVEAIKGKMKGEKT